jgi:hypothetical protein
MAEHGGDSVVHGHRVKAKICLLDLVAADVRRLSTLRMVQEE